MIHYVELHPTLSNVIKPLNETILSMNGGLCNFQILAESAQGYVVYCMDCKMVQLAFGTTMLKLSPEHFQEIASTLRLESASRAGQPTCNTKNVVIPVDDRMMICLTQPELGKIDLLFSEAAVMFETLQILDGMA